MVASGGKLADGDSREYEVCILLVVEKVSSGFSSESSISVVAAPGDTCMMNRLSP